MSVEQDIAFILKNTGSKNTTAKLAADYDVKDWSEFNFFAESVGAPSKVSAKAKYYLLLKLATATDIFADIVEESETHATTFATVEKVKISNVDLLDPLVEAKYQRLYEDLYNELKESDATRLSRYLLYRSFPYDKNGKVNKHYKPTDLGETEVYTVGDGDKEVAADKMENVIPKEKAVNLDAYDAIPANNECLGMVFMFAGSDLKKTQQEFKKLVETHGGEVSDNVDRVTVVVSCPSAFGGQLVSKKIQDAISAGLPIVTSDYLIHLVEKKGKGLQLRNPKQVDAKYLLNGSKFGDKVYHGASIQQIYVKPETKKPVDDVDKLAQGVSKIKTRSSTPTSSSKTKKTTSAKTTPKK
ncbi:poly(ADP-ribosyl)transferase [Tieghemostelium lacteum]|uniref:Poly(ADP-ribosyl)transferase n=1 Tax=Tieghemostelium lacteum TaxID=361077 RepID=A0A151ZHS1_TIELA|nr:poly(ADP-ribosyl)transferase [Tieghemostelium lacteum]|eukprot:KYQ93513.1 poly(ADP-ribosyl)transferase [Tieghemostelium lacteum]